VWSLLPGHPEVSHGVLESAVLLHPSPPVVLDLVVRPAGQLLRDLGPPVSCPCFLQSVFRKARSMQTRNSSSTLSFTLVQTRNSANWSCSVSHHATSGWMDGLVRISDSETTGVLCARVYVDRSVDKC
jgi:hypothetical protein